jgi:hypothetical protein
MQTISGLAGKHRGEVLTAVGRGVSLARLQAQHLSGVVMAINQAVEKVESLDPANPLYSLQKDRYLVKPRKAVLLLHELESLANNPVIDYEPVYSFDVERDFRIRWNLPSVVIAEKFANWFGCRKVVYLCCDSVTDGITDTYGDPAPRPSDYLQHGRLVRKNATLPVEWVRI